MDKKTILVVDDEQNIRDIVEAYLIKDGYKVLQAADGIEALDIFKYEAIDLIILDIMMPGKTGTEVCEQIRLTSNVPIIMLTAKVEETDIITGLKQGADDYIKKPFSVRELVVRVETLLRRTSKDQPRMDTYHYRQDDLIVDLAAIKVLKAGETVVLTPNEFKILRTFIQNPNRVLSRDQIIDITFGNHFEGFDRTIDTHIKNIRAKIEDNPKKPLYINTIYSMGYKFVVGDDV